MTPSDDEALRVGGSYTLTDGREFWIDHLAAKAITARVIAAIAKINQSEAPS